MLKTLTLAFVTLFTFVSSAPAQNAKQQAANCRTFIEQSRPFLPYVVAARAGCKVSDVVIVDALCDGVNSLLVSATTKIKGKKRNVYGSAVYKGGNRADVKNWDASGMIVTK